MRRYVPAAAAALLFACTGITEPICACSPPGGGEAVIGGIVTDPARAPVAGAAVRIRIMHDDTCAEPDTTLTRVAHADAEGRFRHVEAWSGGKKCFRVWAEPPQGAALSASEGELVRIEFRNVVVPDSVELHLRLR